MNGNQNNQETYEDPNNQQQVDPSAEYFSFEGMSQLSVGSSDESLFQHLLQIPFDKIEVPPSTTDQNIYCNPVAGPSSTFVTPQNGFSLTSYPGECGFTVQVPNPPKLTKASPWVYSTVLDKLFIQQGMACPIQFVIDNLQALSPYHSYNNFRVRAQLYLTNPDVYQVTIHCCIVHRPIPSGGEAPNVYDSHVLLCDDLNSFYEEDVNLRHAVVTQLKTPAPGDRGVSYCYRFKCLSSCLGGANRRPMAVLFTLETLEGVAVGRYCLPVRVCRCPGRDIKTEEERAVKPAKRKANDETEELPLPQELTNFKGKKLKVSKSTSEISTDGRSSQLSSFSLPFPVSNDETVYTLQVRGRHLYEYMKDHLEKIQQLMAAFSSVPVVSVKSEV